jgi:hypothetical protein
VPEETTLRSCHDGFAARLASGIMANAMGRSSWNATGTGLSRKSTLEQNTLQPLDNPFGPRLNRGI